jgi:hypothetical protein
LLKQLKIKACAIVCFNKHFIFEANIKYILMKRILIYVFLTCSMYFHAFGQDNVAMKYAGMISKEKLFNHISILAADSLEGRSIGERGHQIASEYIKGQYLQSGLICPSDDSHFQPFKVVKSYWDEMYIRQGNKKYRNLKDGIIYLGEQALPNEKSYKLHFIGNAIHENLMDDYSMVYYNTPYWVSLRRKFSENTNNSFSLIIDHTHANDFDSVAYRMQKSFNTARYNFPVKNAKVKENTVSAFVVSENLAAELFNLKPSRIRRIGAHTGSGVKRFRGFEPVELHVKAERRYDTLVIDNVLGYIEGTDKKDEVLVISAHYDHLGVEGDQIYNGADDNASGVAALLEISRVFDEARKAGVGPRRSILFIAFTGEERGLFGSRYYVENPVKPLKNTIANLNIDMIGRVDEKNADNPEYIYLIGSDKISMDLHNLSESANQTYTQLELDYTFNADDDPNRFYYRSDHYNFAKNNIPVIFYFNGAHEDYHEPTDTIDKIDFDILKKRTHLIFHTAWKLANNEYRPEVP